MLQDNSTNLPHLIGFRVAIVVLQSDSLGDAVPSEYVMASPYPLCETQTPEQTTQAIEADIGIRATTENPLQKLLVSAHA